MLLVIIIGSCIVSLGQADAPAASDSLPASPTTVRLVVDSIVTPGDTFSVSVLLGDTSAELGGFNLLIEYDYGALVFDSATLGNLTRGEWEHFEFRSDPLDPADTVDLRAYVRLIAIADSYSLEGHPSRGSMVGPGEIARLFFYASDRLTLAEERITLRFLWQKCGDNTFSDKSGNRLYLYRAAYDADGAVIDSGPSEYRGPPEDCPGSELNPPVRTFDFYNERFSAGPARR